MNEVSRRLAEITPQQVAAYLTSRNWVQDSELRKIATVWHRQDSGEAEVVLPLSQSVKDYVPRLRDALAALATHEKRQVAEVVNDVIRLGANVITVRVMGADTVEGTIPIKDGVLLIEKAKELLYAAAQSLYSKRKQFSGPLPKDTKAYVDSLLLGQTEVGSYVVNVIAPTNIAQPVPRAANGAPVGESVTLNLVSGLEAISSASARFEQTHDVSVFEAAVAGGASANLCDALLGFSGAERKRSFEIRVSAAAGLMFEGETKVFSFDSADIESLERATGYFKDDYVLQGREITGFIKKLSRPKWDDLGTITVETTVADVERSVQVSLGPEDYHLAVTAHDKKALVSCRGDIRVKSRTAWLLNPTDFKTIELLDLF